MFSWIEKLLDIPFLNKQEQNLFSVTRKLSFVPFVTGVLFMIPAILLTIAGCFMVIPIFAFAFGNYILIQHYKIITNKPAFKQIWILTGSFNLGSLFFADALFENIRRMIYENAEFEIVDFIFIVWFIACMINVLVAGYAILIEYKLHNSR